jgi:hypothetical protein
VSAAALTDHVRDHGYGRTTSEPSISRLEDAHSGSGQGNHAICALSQRNECVPEKMSKVPGTSRPFRRRGTALVPEEGWSDERPRRGGALKRRSDASYAPAAAVSGRPIARSLSTSKYEFSAAPAVTESR